jgi:putative transposase
MGSTLTSILVHATFSTKHREPVIPPDLLPDLFRYMGGVCRETGSRVLHAGGVEDHVHLLISLSKSMSIADLMMHVKRASSSWMKLQSPALRAFAWQDGYFAFSVGHDAIPAVKAYLDGQTEHHRRVEFRDEVVAFLNKYGVEYVAKYLWD